MGRPSRRHLWRFVLVPADAATEATGLTVDQLLALPGTEKVMRRYADGREELALRVPAELAAAVRARP